MLDSIQSPLSGIRSPFGPRLGFSPSALFAAGEVGTWYDVNGGNTDWRRNLLTYTEEFDNAAWTKTNSIVSANAAIAPDNTSTADFLVEDSSAASGHFVTRPVSGSGPLTSSVWVKANGRDRVLLELGSGKSALFDLSTVSVVSENLSGNATITGTAGNWLLISGTEVATDRFRVYLDNGSSVVYDGDGTSGIFIWGAQLEEGSTATDYQRITDVTTEVGERFPGLTVFTDTTATTPATVGDAVAFLLDKSQGAGYSGGSFTGLGDELVTNGTFDTDLTGWTVGTDPAQVVPTWDAGRVSLARGGGGNSGFSQTFSTSGPAGVYLVEFDLVSSTLGGIAFSLSGSVSVLTGVGKKSVILVRSSTTTSIIFWPSSNNATVVLDNISVKELPGYHATQSTAAARPILGRVPDGGRRNLLTYSEEFDNAAWTKANLGITANAIASPDGELNGSLLSYTGTGSVGTLFQDRASTATETSTIYVKAKDVNFVQFRPSQAGASLSNPIFDLRDGSVNSFSGSGVVDAYSTDAGDGWYRITVITDGSSTERFGLTPMNDATTYTSAAADCFYIWGAQVEEGSTATDYQKVTSTYDVTETGKTDKYYLAFDGVDDFLVTPSIDFSGSDEMSVFAGVRKLSDAATAILCELSVGAIANSGSFFVLAPRNTGASGDYAFNARGDASLPSAIVSSTALAPDTSVVTGLSDISASSRIIRRNGSQEGSSSTNLGTGNFGDYPLYIGSRAGSSLPFNGHLYSLITRGKLTADTQLSKTESYVAGKTGVSI